ncbi:uncharacterized protein LOC115668857 [Syzygium oleosum]|uniref:uncharacterized protein LOC115668857 n=1 Tax=Syzygium oleosum TaxID=219896 RepID=UPI0024BA9B1F|nr:uncharacterized protein LOC115668857 [Syzygium oleosum]
MVFAMRSWSANTDSYTESGAKKLMLELKLKVKSRPSEKIKRRAMRVLSLSHLGVDTSCFDDKEGMFTLVGHMNPVEVVFELRKICVIYIVSVAILTARNDAFPTTDRITELILIEDTDLKAKRSSGIRICEEQQEQSQKQQEDHSPPGQADSYISQVEASPLSQPRPPLSLPLASEARPSSSRVSHPSQGTSDQMQAAPDWAPELSFPFAPLSSHTFWTKSLADMPAQSSISGGACLFKDMKLMEEEGLGGQDQLYDSAVHHLISGINGIGELKRRYDLRAGEQANRLKEMEDTAIMLCKQVEELEAKVSMANMSEHRLMDMLRISEDRHARTKKELALMREKMDEADCRIEYLEAAVSRYQNRIAVAEVENEKAEERACGASVGGETMSTPRPSPVPPRSTFLSFVPSPSPRLTDSEVCKESALFPELTYY